MQPFAQELQALIGKLPVQALVEFTNRMAPPDTPEDPVAGANAQMISGYFAMIAEALEGGHRLRDQLLGDALPALRDTGMPVGQMMEGAVRTYAWVAMMLVTQISEKNRPAAIEWLSGFMGRYTRETLSAWERAQA